MPCDGGSVTSDDLGYPLHVSEQLPGVVRERSSGVGQVERFSDLLKEPKTQILFELANLARHRGLRKEQLLGGTGVVKVLQDSQECSQVDGVHDLPNE